MRQQASHCFAALANIKSYTKPDSHQIWSQKPSQSLLIKDHFNLMHRQILFQIPTDSTAASFSSFEREKCKYEHHRHHLILGLDYLQCRNASVQYLNSAFSNNRRHIMVAHSCTPQYGPSSAVCITWQFLFIPSWLLAYVALSAWKPTSRQEDIQIRPLNWLIA